MHINTESIIYVAVAATILIGGIIVFETLFTPAINEQEQLFSAMDAKGQPLDTVIDISSKAPSFTLPATTGNNISLSDYKGKKNVLLYFQEGIMCAPCWKQLEDIQKEYGKFDSLDVEVLTITVDPLNALIKESQKRGITLPVLDDGDDLSVSKEYDVLDQSMHPGSRPGHSFILIGKDGDIIWRKDYYPAGQNMGGMNMNMGGRMYVPVEELLTEINKIAYRLSPTVSNTSRTPIVMNIALSSPSNAAPAMDHSMCITPIHKHADLKVYLDNVLLNMSQRKFMDQNAEVHFHPTVKVNPNDVPGVPFGDMVHIHKENVTIKDFLNTLDLDTNNTLGKLIGNNGMMRVYVNEAYQEMGLNYVMNDQDRVLVTQITDGITEKDILTQIESVTSYAVMGKDANPSIFGGC
ncbi:MAG: peroxiredoxin family protein [Nitrososphaeraceae archaeon]